jgi:hypothetical protein
VKDLPKGDTDIHETKSGHGPAHPSRSDYRLQHMQTGFARNVQQKIIVAPVAQAKRALRDPGQEYEQKAEHQQKGDFQAENDVEDAT